MTILDEPDIAWLAPPQETITETDIQTDGLYLSDEELEEEAEDWAFWEEVRECCGGRDWMCGHFRAYPPPMERDDW